MDESEALEDYHDEKTPQFTKILDLTNGQGGELRRPYSHHSSNHQPTTTAPMHGSHHHANDAYSSNYKPQQQQEQQPIQQLLHQEQEQHQTELSTASTDDANIDQDAEDDEEIAMAEASSEDPGLPNPLDAEAVTGQPRGTLSSSINSTNNKSSSASSNTKVNTGLGKGNINPNTPGKVVEAGQEQTGRWTKQEHEAFLSALRMYGKEWKKVAAKVKTRTVVQTRTHAQKYFQKLQKVQESSVSGAEVDYVDMGLVGDNVGTVGAVAAPAGAPHKAGRISTSSHKKKPRHLPIAAISTSASPLPLPVSIAKTNRRGSNATLSAAQVISALSHSATSAPAALSLMDPDPEQSASPAAAALAPPKTQAAAIPTISSFAPLSNRRLQQHGFSTEDRYLASPPPGWASATTAVTASAAVVPGGLSMKIVAPDPMDTMSAGNFPEPSPAATGKRKLAELAAARMLAGVAGVVAVPPQLNENDNIHTNHDINYRQNDTSNSIMDNNSKITEDVISAFDDREEGAVTPPPEPYGNSAMGEINLKDAPAPPLFGAKDPDRKARPLSLQIVNPETLGITYEKKRKMNDCGSPVTPWESELEALVNEKSKANTTLDTCSNDPQSASDSICEAVSRKISAPKVSHSVERTMHPVCGPGNAFGRSTLHRAVCEIDIELLKEQLGLIVNGIPGVLARLDGAGYAPLHTAASLRLRRPENTVAAQEMVRTLLSVGADPNIVDGEGNTPLHWASRAGDQGVAEILLFRNNPLKNTQNKHGETALHWGMRAGKIGLGMVTFLVKNGADITSLNKRFRRPIDLAAEGFLDTEGSIASLKQREDHERNSKNTSGNKMSRELKKVLRDKLEEIRETRANLFSHSWASRTLLLHHRECLEHVPKSTSDWEAPDRVVAILDRIAQPTDLRDHEIVVSNEFERANLDLLSRVHSTDYLHFVQNLAKDLEKQVKERTHDRQGRGGGNGSEGGIQAPHVVPFTPMVQRSMIKVSESAVKSIANSDTAFSVGSLRAARRAAGAVQHAVDCVLVGRNRNAFCVVRPPGHHAGVSGLLDGGESCGFCIFNNIAAGALYAISDERLLCKRCAIVDIDVHHGNGTEEIVRKCSDPSKLFFFSIHLYDNDKRKRGGNNQFHYKFYPGTGSDDDLAMNIINVPIVPLWREQSMPSAPVTRSHNTRQKARGSDQEESPAATPIGARNTDTGSECGSVNMPSPKQSSKASPALSGRVAYRDAILNRLLPALRAFNPDLILISAGFDAVKGDVGNARHERGGKERIGLDLEPEDYAWTTRKVLEIADICCNGRVVSVLEGGYGRSVPPQPSAPDEEVRLEPLDRSVFSECAVRHLHALVDPYDVERRFTSNH